MIALTAYLFAAVVIIAIFSLVFQILMILVRPVILLISVLILAVKTAANEKKADGAEKNKTFPPPPARIDIRH